MTSVFDNRGHNFKWIIYVVDVIILTLVFAVFANWIVEVMGWRNYASDSRFYWNRYGHLFVFLLSYFTSVSLIRIKLKDLDSRLDTLIRAAAQVVLMYFLFIIFVWILFHTFPGHLIMWSGIINGILICLSHCVIREIIINRRSRNVVKVLFMGADDNNVSLYKEIKHGFSTYSYKILGFFSSLFKDNVPADSKYLGKVTDVYGFLVNNDVDMVLCSLDPAHSSEVINQIIRHCEKKFISFYYVPNMEGYPHRHMHFNQWGGVTTIRLHDAPLNDPYKRAEKRVVDIVVSGIFLLTLFPLIFIVVSIGILISSSGPIFFKQKRTGYNGRTFTMLKFRSMKVNVYADTLQATVDDPRKTKFGDFLRRTSIDELPQFINVLKGDMSLVGPRPHMELHTEQYSKLIDGYFVRHLCKPGLTGYAQVNGCRGETKTVEEMADRVRYDIWYIENWSLLLDMKIILKTMIQIFKGDEQAY